MTLDDRSDLIRSPILGVPNNFYSMKKFEPRPPSGQNGHLSVLGIKRAPLLGTPIKFLTKKLTTTVNLHTLYTLV